MTKNIAENETFFFRELIKTIKEKKLSKEELSKIKQGLCKKYNIKKPPTDIEILTRAEKEELEILKLYLKTKPVRTISGVAVIAIMAKPSKCPHGRCIYCPGGPSSYFGDVPQSYTGKEPATMRAIRSNFDPYVQVFSRLEQYFVSGHNPEKVELIIMGGTFPSLPKRYQENFVAGAFKAMNDFSKLFYKNRTFDFDRFREFFELPGSIHDKIRTKKIIRKIKSIKNKTKIVLEKEQKINEKSNIRCVGLTIETRADYANEKEAKQLLKFGCTRVELGVQSVYDSILENIERGHSVEKIIDAFRTLKDFGFKINAHYMIGLPGSNVKMDIEGLKRLFSDENFRPDMLKIYPCLVMKGTKLYDLWKNKKYKPLNIETAAAIIAEFKRHVPEYCRIMRIQRDIPSHTIAAGPIMTNLRQYVNKLTKEKGIECRCIRCREIKNQEIKKPELLVKEYCASGGKEFFISFEENDKIIGFCRLRFPSDNNKVAFVRELHVYGPAESLKEKGKIQHRGFGKRLLKKAENIALINNKKKIFIISGIGVREYYRKLGYKKSGSYMVKVLHQQKKKKYKNIKN
ncbi:MAG: tRNA uridine(34) 5-carboxymethylaminomethyl modification radical SAM/GNAT enzyme Elp3 [Candidatus Woesearchaeota archaeon]